MKNDSEQIQKFGLTTFQLKIIALITMISDHAGLMFHGYNGADLSWMRVMGRISFPLFAFLISEGCRHTRSMSKYMLRLLSFALISQICFLVRIIYLQIVGDDGGLFDGLPNYNVFFTLLLGVVSVYGYNEIMDSNINAKYIASLLPFAAAMYLAHYLGTDYGAIGVFMIFSAYIAKNRKMQMFAIFISIIFLYYDCLGYEFYQMLVSGSGLTFLMPFFAALSLPLIGMYNGKKGAGWKWFFYIAYPGHFAILGILYIILIYFI